MNVRETEIASLPEPFAIRCVWLVLGGLCGVFWREVIHLIERML